MNQPRLSDLAVVDLDELWIHLARTNSEAADRIVDAILESSRFHVRFPNIGQRRDDLLIGVRCFVVAPYVVYYRQIDGTIEVLRVIHGAREVTRLIEPMDY